MFKNLLIVTLILICTAQSYILYSNKDKDWLVQSVKQAKQDINKVIHPTPQSDDSTSVTTTISNSNTIQKLEPSPVIIPATTTTSFAFDHLDSMIECDAPNNKLERIICANSDLLDQDKRMNFVLQKWKKSTKTSEFNILNQPEWLNERNSNCIKNDIKDTQACIKTMTEIRIQAITGQL
ncbi:hypothetical protein [Marinicellulosiphila megalodicopiae]|uniref:hypothetical protein n=1 Tax=Marinicellulosiphila megalodicopiae TaxID=2724896 RepID=UPI003BB19DA3